MPTVAAGRTVARMTSQTRHVRPLDAAERLGPGPVLVGVDDRPPAEAAVAVGAELATRLGRELVLATIYEGHGWRPRARGADEADRRATADALLSHMGDLALSHGAQGRLRSHADGSPPTGLRELVADEHPSLLILGSSHRRELLRLVAEGTPQRLLSDGFCPVVVVPRLPSGRRLAGRPVVVGCDGSPCADTAQATAAAVAAALDSPLFLWHAHVADRPPGAPGGQEFGDPLHAAGARILDRARRRVPEGLEVMSENLVGPPASVLGERARAAHVGLLVVGARGYSCGFRLGRMAERLALDPSCPLMVAPPPHRPA